jgi:hypothetical protein
MLKKLLGILLIILGGLFTLGVLSSIFTAIIVPRTKTGNVAYDSGFAFGYWIFIVFLSVIIFFMFKVGLKLVKKKKINVESIDEIGREI